jgi:DNA-binding protein HU-beta
MTKLELCGKVGKAANVPGTTVELVLDALGRVAATELRQSGEIPLPGIGKLKIKQRAAREGRNPRTGATIQVPAKKAVVFSVGKTLKETLA